MKFVILSLALSLSINVMASVKHLPFTSTPLNDADKVELTPDEQQYFQISDITVEEVETPMIYRDLEDKGALDDIAMQLDKLIAIGKKVWAIIEKNKPVLNTDFSKAISVIPAIQGESDPSTTFSMMSDWQMPKAKTFRVVYKNGFGMKVIEFNYTVTFQYGGKYQGKGAYLTGVNVFANNISVSWGFTFNANSSLVTISNMGSMKDPVAGATIRIDYRTDSVMRAIFSSQMFHVTGKGVIQGL